MQNQSRLNSTRYFFSERTVELILSFDDCEGMNWCEISGRKLDSLAPHSVQVLEFQAVPVAPGLRFISGIRLLDTLLKRTYSYDELGQVFVVINEKECDSKSI